MCRRASLLLLFFFLSLAQSTTPSSVFRRRIVVVPNEDVVAPKCVSLRDDELRVVRIVVVPSFLSSFEKQDDEKDFRRSRRLRRLDDREGDLPFSTHQFFVKPRLGSISCITSDDGLVFDARAR